MKNALTTDERLDETEEIFESPEEDMLEDDEPEEGEIESALPEDLEQELPAAIVSGAEADEVPFLQQMGQFALLSREDERRLGAEKDLFSKETTTPEERERGRRARDAMANANYRLVVSIARRYQHRGVPLADLISEGNLGLLTAVDRFDWRRGFKFSTYATWWIQQSCQRAVASQGRLIRLPAQKLERMNECRRATAALTATFSREPTAAELAEYLDTDVAEIEELQEHLRQPASLQAPVGDGDDDLGALLPDDRQLPVEDQVAGEFARTSLAGALALLDPLERRVIELRYGLDSHSPSSLQEVASDLGLNKLRVREIEHRASRKLAENAELQALVSGV